MFHSGTLWFNNHELLRSVVTSTAVEIYVSHHLYDRIRPAGNAYEAIYMEAAKKAIPAIIRDVVREFGHAISEQISVNVTRMDDDDIKKKYEGAVAIVIRDNDIMEIVSGFVGMVDFSIRRRLELVTRRAFEVKKITFVDFQPVIKFDFLYTPASA